MKVIGNYSHKIEVRMWKKVFMYVNQKRAGIISWIKSNPILFNPV